MRQLPTAAALAILLITAGFAGVVSADPTSTDYQTTADAKLASSDARLAATAQSATAQVAVDVSDADDATFEQQLARRLAQYDLTDVQIREVVTEASRLKEAGASRLVVRSSVVMNLYEFGVDAPFLYAGGGDDRPGDGHDAFHRIIRGLDVTPEQARELHAMVHRMLDAGADRGEIRRAVAATLDAWDVDRPTDVRPDDARPDGDDARPDGVDRLVHSLVDRYDLDREQAAELERLIRGMLDSGAHRGEIREAVSRLLNSYGVDDPTPADVRVRR